MLCPYNNAIMRRQNQEQKDITEKIELEQNGFRNLENRMDPFQKIELEQNGYNLENRIRLERIQLKKYNQNRTDTTQKIEL